MVTALALSNRRLTLLLVFLIALQGAVVYASFASREDPSVTIREAVVTANFPGMAPERVEDLITRRMEEAIRQIPEVEHITSSSTTGQSLIHVQVFDRFFDLEPIWQDLRNQLADAAPDLPDGTLGPFVNDDFGDVAVYSLAITGDGFTRAELRDMARDLRDRLYAVDGVKRIDLLGIQPERIFLETTNARLSQFGLTVDSLIATLQTQNIILPGGRVFTGTRDVVIEPSGNFEDVRQITDTILPIPNSDDLVPLRDIVDIRTGFADPPSEIAYWNGREAVVLSVSMMEGANVLDFGPRLLDRLEALRFTVPIGMEIHVATDQTRHVERAIRSVTSSLYQTLGIVLAVVILFLGVRTGVIVGLMVPMTMLLALVLMAVFGIDLQRMSLASLIISLGLLVDNGIVIAEDIRRRLGAGEERRAACIAAGREMAIPLLTSSLTTILAFAPLMLAQNQAGEYTRSLAYVISITLLGSWLLALTATPMFCYWFARAKASVETAEAYSGPLFDGFRSLIRAILWARVPFLAAMVLLLVAAGWLSGQIPRQFFPNSDRDQFLIYLDLPAGVSIHQTDEAAHTLMDWLGDRERNPEIRDSVGYVGFGGPRFILTLSPEDPAPNRAFFLVQVDGLEHVDALIDRTRRYIATQIPEARGRVKRMFLGPSETGLVELRISGPNAQRLFDHAKSMEAALNAIPGTIDVMNDWENQTVKVAVEVDQARARRAQVTSQDIAQALNGFFSGIEITDFRDADTLVPIVLRASASERGNLDRVRTISVQSSATGEQVPLLQIATFRPVPQFSRIERRDLERTITISAKHVHMTAAELQAALAPALADLDAAMTPVEWREWGGETEGANNASTALFSTVPLCIGLIVVLMVAQFGSYRKAAVVLLTIPLSFIGAILGLYLTGSFFGFMEIMGIFSLAGIIVNNAIVLLERIQLELDEGADPYTAVVEAAVKRLRPILMTTLTTILGLMPLIIAQDVLFSGMAIVIASGLALGTVMTLGAAPAMYAVFHGVKRPRPTEPAPAPVSAPAAAAAE